MKPETKYEQVDMKELFDKQGLTDKGYNSETFRQISLNFGGFVIYANKGAEDIDLDDLVVDYMFGDSAVPDVTAEPLMEYLCAKFGSPKAAKRHLMELIKQKPN
jgi:hypothetical protein